MKLDETALPVIEDAAHHPPGSLMYLTEAITPEAWAKLKDDQGAKEQLCEQLSRWHTELIWARGWCVVSTGVAEVAGEIGRPSAVFTSTCKRREANVLRAVADAPS